jgi:hypothetical protein
MSEEANGVAVSQQVAEMQQAVNLPAVFRRIHNFVKESPQSFFSS